MKKYVKPILALCILLILAVAAYMFFSQEKT